MVLARLRVKAFEVDVSIDTPAFDPVIVKDLTPVPLDAVEPESVAATPWVVVIVVAGVEIVGSGLTVTVMVSLAIAPAASVAVTTMLYEFVATEDPTLSETKFEPIVEESMVIPLGKVDVAKVRAPVPPVTLIIRDVARPTVVLTVLLGDPAIVGAAFTTTVRT
jgi:hypothetical protein